MTINFRTFDTGIRISPGLSSDPITGKIGQIYWNTANSVFRVCISEFPVVWNDLFLQPGTVSNSSIYWNSGINKWSENVNLRFNNSTIYTPDNNTPIDLILEAGDSTDLNQKGGSIFLRAGNGLAGSGQIFIESNLISPVSISSGNGRDVTISAGSTSDLSSTGGDLTLMSGSGGTYGDVSINGLNINVASNNNLNFTANQNSFFNSNYLKIQSNSIGLKALNSTNPSPNNTADIYFETNYNRFKKYDGSNWHWWDINKYNIPTVSIDLYDTSINVLPATTSTQVDGTTVLDKMLILAPLASLNIKKAAVDGLGNITWSDAKLGIDSSGVATSGDQIYVLSGIVNSGNTYRYNSNLFAWQLASLPKGLQADNILRYNGSSWVVDNLTSIDGTGSIYLKDDSNNNNIAAASLYLKASNKLAGTGNGGNITISAGGSSGGNQGSIYLSGKYAQIPIQPALSAADTGSILWYNNGSTLSGAYIANGINYNRFDSADINGEITGFSDLSQTSVSFNSGTRQVTLGVASIADYYIKGQQVRLSSSVIVTLPSSSGLYYVTIGSNQSMGYTTSLDAKTITSDNALIAIIYYDSSIPAMSTVIDARNLVTIDWANREYNRQVWGSGPTGFGITLSNLTPDGSSATDYQFSIASGVLRTTDRTYSIPSASVSSSQISVAYNSGSTGYSLNSANTIPVYVSGGIPQWNKLISGSWTIQPVTNNYYYNYWVVAIHSQANQIISVAGQNQYATPYEAFSETWDNVQVPGFDKAEMEPLYRITYVYRSGYSNSAKSIIILAQSLFNPNSTLFSLAALPATINQNQNTIMTGGGTSVYNASTGLLSWSETAYINVPGVSQSMNSISSGSVTLSADGTVAYVSIKRANDGATPLTVSTTSLSNLVFTGAGADLTYVIAYKLNGVVYFNKKPVLTEKTLSDNTTDTLLAYTGINRSIKIDYSIVRGSSPVNVETGTLMIAGGASPAISRVSATSGDIGTTFSVSASGATLTVTYTTESTGSSATIRYSLNEWLFI